MVPAAICGVKSPTRGKATTIQTKNKKIGRKRILEIALLNVKCIEDVHNKSCVPFCGI